MNKPVARIVDDCDIEWTRVHNLPVGTLLYTAPRELSDEEIGLMTTDPRWEHIESPLLWEFARELLKKASEK